MLEELQRRHYSEATTLYYLRKVKAFARHFQCSPDRLGRQHIREYQAYLFTQRKLSPGSVTNHLCALRFFYIQTLKKPWSIADTPYPKKRYRLPTILSQEEVAQLIDAAPTPFHRTILMTLYATGVRRTELTRLKVSDVDSRRMVIHIQRGKGRQDRDVMLSPVLLEELRAHWRRLRKKSSLWLFPGNLALLAQPKIFASWLRLLFRKDWVVYSKPPFGGPEYVLHYLGRYTHRVAISNHRLLSLEDGQVTFRWRDSAHNNEQKLMTLSLDEFLRRFLLHLLPKGFVRIRHFGFLANRRRTTVLPLCFAALDSAPAQAVPKPSTLQNPSPLRPCPKCGGTMVVVERLGVEEIQLRSPPTTSTAAA